MFYILSVIVPTAGIIIGIIYYVKPDPELKRVGRNCLIISIAITVAWVGIVLAIYAVLISTFNTALVSPLALRLFI